MATSNSWIKLYMEILNDPKLARMSDHLWRRTIEVFMLAGQQGQNGILPPIDDMAWTLRTDPETLTTELEALERVKILSHADGIWTVTKFAVRQGPSPAKQRMTEYRKRKTGNDPVTNRNTECYAVKTPDTDTDTDTDADADADADDVTRDVTSRVTKPSPPSALIQQFDNSEPVRAYRELSGVNPNELQARKIVATAMNNIPLWRETVQHWIMHGWKPGNVQGMLELYNKGGPPGCAACQKPNGNGNRTAQQRRPPANEPAPLSPDSRSMQIMRDLESTP